MSLANLARGALSVVWKLLQTATSAYVLCLYGGEDRQTKNLAELTERLAFGQCRPKKL